MEKSGANGITIDLSGICDSKLMDLDRLRIFKNIWKKQPKSWVIDNIDENLIIFGKISKELNELNKDLKEAKKKCVGKIIYSRHRIISDFFY